MRRRKQIIANIHETKDGPNCDSFNFAHRARSPAAILRPVRAAVRTLQAASAKRQFALAKRVIISSSGIISNARIERTSSNLSRTDFLGLNSLN